MKENVIQLREKFKVFISVENTILNMSYTMDCTSDVQNELNAMSGLTNAAIGANRITSKNVF